MKRKNMKKKRYRAIEMVATAITGFLIIPPLVEKCSNKLYKYSLRKDEKNKKLGSKIMKKSNVKKE